MTGWLPLVLVTAKSVPADTLGGLRSTAFPQVLTFIESGVKDFELSS